MKNGLKFDFLLKNRYNIFIKVKYIWLRSSVG